MTKQELENSRFWKALPSNTEIVFNTALRGEDCMPLRTEDLAFRSEIVGWARKDMLMREAGIEQSDPIKRDFLVINTNPY